MAGGLFFISWGQDERETGANQRSAKRETKPPPASWKKAVGGQEKPPDSRWQGRRRVKVSARVCEAKKTTHNSETKCYLKREGGLRQPKTRAEKHTRSETQKTNGDLGLEG